MHRTIKLYLQCAESARTADATLGQIKQETKKENIVFKSRHLRIIYVKKEKIFYLFNLIEKIIYCFKNNDNYFWILKCRVLYTIFFLYFYFAFLYFCIFPSEFPSLGDPNYILYPLLFI